MAKKKSNQPLVVQQITIKAPQRRVYDIGDWRTALRAADYGRAQRLYDLFDDLTIDGTLSDAMEKRIDAVLNAALIFTDRTGNEDTAITPLIESTAWTTLMRQVMNQRFYGRAGAEITFNNGFEVAPIKPKYIDLRRRRILLDDADSEGVGYEEDWNLLIMGRDDDFGLLLKATPYAIWKRGGFGDYAQWIELFGMPQRIGKYNTFDTESRKLLEEAMEKAGSAPYLIVPKEAEIETREVGSNSGSSFNEFRQACNEEILITMLGQTLTTTSGERGARSLGEVHMAVEADKHMSDLRFVQRMLNERVVPILAAAGFNVEGGKFIFPQAAEPLSVEEVVRLSGIIDIPAKYLYDKYAIPQPEGDEPIAGRKPVVEEVEVVEESTGENAAKKPARNSDGSTFLRRLWDFFVQAPQGGAMNGTIPTKLSDGASLDQRVMHRVAAGGPKFDTELFRFISEGLLSAVRTADKGIRNADVDFAYDVTDSAMQTAMEINLYRFSAAKTLAEVRELNRIFRQSKNYKDFEAQASKVCRKFNEQYQQTEFDTAYLSAEAASNYLRLMRLSKVAPYWEYVTARDSRVREAHRWLDGVILPYNDPAWKKIFPPNGWNCRCIVTGLTKNQLIQRLANEDKEWEERSVFFGSKRERVERFYQTEDWKRAVRDGWGVNRALRGEVFSENQFYIQKFPKLEKTLLAELHHDDWGLPSFEEKLATATREMPRYEGSAAEWYEQHKTFKDYLGREVVMPYAIFKQHTKPETHYASERIPLLECIGDIVSAPDEVWLNNHKYDQKGVFNNLNMIKFYEDNAINVICRISSELKYEISTWFKIEPDSKDKDNPKLIYRRGLLIKK